MSRKQLHKIVMQNALGDSSFTMALKQWIQQEGKKDAISLVVFPIYLTFSLLIPFLIYIYYVEDFM